MALTYASALAQIVTHAAAAGAALSNPVLDVAAGAPLPTDDRCVRVFYAGESEPAHMGAGTTLNSRLISERIELYLWIRLSGLTVQEIASVESELYTFKHELRTRVLGDSQLGGMSTDLEMDLCVTDWVTVGTSRYRLLTTAFTTDFAEYSIAQ